VNRVMGPAIVSERRAHQNWIDDSGKF